MDKTIVKNLCFSIAFVAIGLVLNCIGDFITNHKIKKMRMQIETLQETIDTLAAEKTDTEDLSRSDTLLAMATAFAFQETKLNNIVSYDGLYAGYLQISKSMVSEANNILGYTCFRTDGYIDDRMDWNGSVAIFTVVMEHHNPTLDIDRAIEIWNRYAPNVYAKSVKNYYKFLLENVKILAVGD